MPRKPRVWYPGAMYHITSRGNRKAPLFLDDYDRNFYLRLLQNTKEKIPFNLLSYCLMTNHTHLQLQTSESSITKIMLQINTSYAKYFNRKYDLVGHVFQGRYGAELIENQEYEIDVSKYIHLNPCRAGMVQEPEHYLWSSYTSYLAPGTLNKYSLVSPQRILSYFPDQQTYKKYIDAPTPLKQNIVLLKKTK
ncbi:transposase [Pseudalkalibacillus caeni]|uniref:Transposase n=1 Tax=Exobacillus caeni TaxID=2574798 RepID=A0A5R9F3Z4_9BACL|nr:transposase [Pseudalkalibacillus caeni]TLS35583.1 transposase [Pseudalkalibacillus caeni]